MEQMMALRKGKTEHNGAKNGDKRLTRAEVKDASRKQRRTNARLATRGEV